MSFSPRGLLGALTAVIAASALLGLLDYAAAPKADSVDPAHASTTHRAGFLHRAHVFSGYVALFAAVALAPAALGIALRNAWPQVRHKAFGATLLIGVILAILAGAGISFYSGSLVAWHASFHHASAGSFAAAAEYRLLHMGLSLAVLAVTLGAAWRVLSILRRHTRPAAPPAPPYKDPPTFQSTD